MQIGTSTLRKKLNELYDKEERIVSQLEALHLEYKQIQEDKELLQTMYMHQSNREDRLKKKTEWHS